MKFLLSFTAITVIAGCLNAPTEAGAVGAQEAKFPSAPGTLIALNKAENTASIIDLETGKTVKKLDTGPNPNEVAFSPDGKTAVVSDMGSQQVKGETLTIIDLPSKRVAKKINLGEHGAAHGIVWLDLKRVVITSHMSNSVVTVNIEEGKIEKVIPTGQHGTHLVLLSPDKKKAYAANAASNSVSIIDLEAGKVIKNVICEAGCEGIALSPDGAFIAAGNRVANTVSIVDTAKGEVVHTIKDTAMPIRTWYTEDGKHLLVSCVTSGEIAVFNAKDHSQVKRFKLADVKVKIVQGEHPVSMNFAPHPNGKYVYIVLVNANAVAVFDLEKLAVVGTMETGGIPDGIAVSPLKTSS